jgi:hypothetical protein
MVLTRVVAIMAVNNLYIQLGYRLIKWNMAPFNSWKFSYHCTHKHSLLYVFIICIYELWHIHNITYLLYCTLAFCTAYNLLQLEEIAQNTFIVYGVFMSGLIFSNLFMLVNQQTNHNPFPCELANQLCRPTRTTRGGGHFSMHLQLKRGP